MAEESSRRPRLELGRRDHGAAGRRARPRPSPRPAAVGRRRPGTAAFGGKLPEQRGAADPRPGDQPDADRRPGRPPRHARLRRGRGPQGRRLRRHPGPAEALRRGPGVRHASRRAGHPRPRRSARESPGCCRCPRSSTWPTCTTRSTRSAARPRRCRSSPRAPVPQPDGRARRRLRLPEGLRRPLPQRQLASPRCATSPAWSSPPPPGPTTPPPCCAPAWPPPAPTARVCVFLEPIALYHTRDLFDDGDDGWLAPYAPPARWAETHIPIGRARTLRRRHRPDHRDVRQRPADEPARRRSGSPTEGISCRVLDLRWLSPLPVEDLMREAELTGKRADRRRDPPHRRRLRGRHRRAGRRRLHRPDRAA